VFLLKESLRKFVKVVNKREKEEEILRKISRAAVAIVFYRLQGVPYLSVDFFERLRHRLHDDTLICPMIP